MRASLDPNAFDQKCRAAGELLRAGKLAEATQLCEALAAQHPEQAASWLTLARLRHVQGEFPAMSDAARRAYALSPRSAVAFVLVDALFLSGEGQEARALLARIEASAGADYMALRKLSEHYSRCSDFHAAERCARAALTLRPHDADALYNLTPATIALGKLDESEALFDQVIAARPDDWDAYYNRATLRNQTPERNHVPELRAVLAASAAKPAALTAVGYALAKELEDLGDYEESFAWLLRAAAARRRGLSYKVEVDIDAMARIAETFGDAYAQRSEPGYVNDAPIFIIGLPRSGTTLVDRILSQHANVESRGELADFAVTLTRATAGAADKSARIAAAARVDPAELGGAYCASVRGWGEGPARLIDKTPLNFLYVGLIARALPNASIVHVRRGPMASCYAMFKTLFRMGYPFSYDLSDLARYYAAYERLMAHWRATFPERVIDIAYEDLVAEQEKESRKLLWSCGLSWTPDCLAFHENASPSATASAAQVRQPIYRSSLEQWRRYERELEPLAQLLEAEGVSL